MDEHQSQDASSGSGGVVVKEALQKLGLEHDYGLDIIISQIPDSHYGPSLRGLTPPPPEPVPQYLVKVLADAKDETDYETECDGLHLEHVLLAVTKAAYNTIARLAKVPSRQNWVSVLTELVEVDPLTGLKEVERSCKGITLPKVETDPERVRRADFAKSAYDTWLKRYLQLLTETLILRREVRSLLGFPQVEEERCFKLPRKLDPESFSLDILLQGIDVQVSKIKLSSITMRETKGTGTSTTVCAKLTFCDGYPDITVTLQDLIQGVLRPQKRPASSQRNSRPAKIQRKKDSIKKTPPYSAKSPIGQLPICPEEIAESHIPKILAGIPSEDFDTSTPDFQEAKNLIRGSLRNAFTRPQWLIVCSLHRKLLKEIESADMIRPDAVSWMLDHQGVPIDIPHVHFTGALSSSTSKSQGSMLSNTNNNIRDHTFDFGLNDEPDPGAERDPNASIRARGFLHPDDYRDQTRLQELGWSKTPHLHRVLYDNTGMRCTDPDLRSGFSKGQQIAVGQLEQCQKGSYCAANIIKSLGAAFRVLPGPLQDILSGIDRAVKPLTQLEAYYALEVYLERVHIWCGKLEGWIRGYMRDKDEYDIATVNGLRPFWEDILLWYNVCFPAPASTQTHDVLGISAFSTYWPDSSVADRMRLFEAAMPHFYQSHKFYFTLSVMVQRIGSAIQNETGGIHAATSSTRIKRCLAWRDLLNYDKVWKPYLNARSASKEVFDERDMDISKLGTVWEAEVLSTALCELGPGGDAWLARPRERGWKIATACY